jgi:hypothetical protein
MELITGTVIPRHAVAVDADGLSIMQAELLNSTAPFVLASAPTGAGKSYVYRRAVERGERVLFVVPTRRLAQNLVSATRSDLMASGWPEAKCLKKVLSFTSDDTAPLKAEGVESVRKWRLARLHRLSIGDGGEIIFATPEAVSWLLLHPFPGDGLGDVGPATFMEAFDRIVFDEFHLVQPRGFGLVALFALLSAKGHWGRVGDGPVRAKVSALSATPADVRTVMERLGLPLGPENFVCETITADGGRALHGDVSLEFVNAESMVDVLQALRPDVAALPDGHTAAVLYDSLRDLQRDKPALTGIADGLGLIRPDDGFFVDSSIDGQHETSTSGRSQQLERRKLLVATSTIEVGVTLGGLVLLAMEPGFSPLSFMQRIGRVARRDRPGRVVVRISTHMLAQRPWLNALVEKTRASGGSISITELAAFMADQARVGARFAATADDVTDRLLGGQPPAGAEGMECFSTMSVQGAFATGVYWHMLTENLSRAGLANQANGLVQHAPAVTGVIRGWLREVGAGTLEGGKPWVKAFLDEARSLRDFSPSVAVIDCDGKRTDVSEAWLSRHTTVLEQYPVSVGEDGRSLVRVDDLDWAALVRGKGDVGKYTRPALLPYRQRTAEVGRAPVEEFRDCARRQKAELMGGRKRAVDAAVSLVSATGVVPYADSTPGAAGASALVL